MTEIISTKIPIKTTRLMFVTNLLYFPEQVNASISHEQTFVMDIKHHSMPKTANLPPKT